MSGWVVGLVGGCRLCWLSLLLLLMLLLLLSLLLLMLLVLLVVVISDAVGRSLRALSTSTITTPGSIMAIAWRQHGNGLAIAWQ